MTKKRLLLDTNVLLDMVVPNRAGHSAAVNLVSDALSAGFTLLYPARVLGDVFYIASSDAKRLLVRDGLQVTDEMAHVCNAYAWDAIDKICAIATAVGEDESDVWMACKLRAINKDLEDCFVMAAARRAEADYLVTSDKGLHKHASVATVSPTDLLQLIHEGVA